MKKCAYVLPDTSAEGSKYQCKHTTWDKEGLCIFHSKQIEDKQDKFEKDIDRLLDAEEGVDLRGFRFPEFLLINFEFQGVVDFSYAEFYGDFDIAQCLFEYGFNISNCVFKKDLSIHLCEVKTLIECENAKVSKIDSVSNYYDLATFEKIYGGSISLTKDIIATNLSFEGSEFHKISIDGIRLEHKMGINKFSVHELHYFSHIGERLCFYNEIIVIDAENENGILSFEDADCQLLTFNEVDLSRASFFGANIEKTRFINCHWPNDHSVPYVHAYLHEGIYITDDKDTARLFRLLYQQLQRNYELERNFALAGHFHFREMEARYYEKLWKDLDKWVLLFYRWVADYGENWKKLALVTPLSIIFSGGLVAINETSKIQTYWAGVFSKLESIMPNIYSFTSAWYQGIKYVFKTIVPYQIQRNISHLSDLSKLVLIAESLMILLLSTLLIMAMRRNFKR